MRISIKRMSLDRPEVRAVKAAWLSISSSTAGISNREEKKKKIDETRDEIGGTLSDMNGQYFPC